MLQIGKSRELLAAVKEKAISQNHCSCFAKYIVSQLERPLLNYSVGSFKDNNGNYYDYEPRLIMAGYELCKFSEIDKDKFIKSFEIDVKFTNY